MFFLFKRIVNMKISNLISVSCYQYSYNGAYITFLLFAISLTRRKEITLLIFMGRSFSTFFFINKFKVCSLALFSWRLVLLDDVNCKIVMATLNILIIIMKLHEACFEVQNYFYAFSIRHRWSLLCDIRFLFQYWKIAHIFNKPWLIASDKIEVHINSKKPIWSSFSVVYHGNFKYWRHSKIFWGVITTAEESFGF